MTIHLPLGGDVRILPERVLTLLLPLLLVVPAPLQGEDGIQGHGVDDRILLELDGAVVGRPDGSE